MSVGGDDPFKEVLRAGSEADSMRRRLQLKTLLFGMGETFRVLTLKRCEGER